MRQLIVTLLASIPLLSMADNHIKAGGGYLAVETQLCSLNEGKTMKQYMAVINRHFEFADQHDFKITGFRQTPLFTKNGPTNPPQYEFIER